MIYYAVQENGKDSASKCFWTQEADSVTILANLYIARNKYTLYAGK